MVRLAAWYAAKRGGRISSDGHRRIARADDIAEWTPKARAS